MTRPSILHPDSSLRPRAAARRPVPRRPVRGSLLARMAVTALLATATTIVLLAGCANPSVQGGNVHSDEGRPAEAEAQFREALARHPDDADAHLGLARVLVEQGRTAEAVTHYERAADLDPDLAARAADDRRRYQGRFVADAKDLLDEGRPAEARASLAAAADLLPLDAEGLVLEGRLEEQRGDLSDAEASYRKALQVEPGDREAREALAGVLGDIGRVHYEAGRYGDAERAVNEALELDPKPDLHYLLGTIAYARAQESTDEERILQLDRAAAEFREVLRKDHEDDDARFNLGAVLLASEQFEEAADVYLELIARHPEQGDLYMALARAHSLVGELALTATEEAIGRALRVGEPVEDPSRWARRSAERFPHTELATTYLDRMVPDEIRTYTIPGGGLVEVWFYWRESVVEAFREGGRLGPAFHLPKS